MLFWKMLNSYRRLGILIANMNSLERRFKSINKCIRCECDETFMCRIYTINNMQQRIKYLEDKVNILENK